MPAKQAGAVLRGEEGVHRRKGHGPPRHQGARKTPQPLHPRPLGTPPSRTLHIARGALRTPKGSPRSPLCIVTAAPMTVHCSAEGAIVKQLLAEGAPPVAEVYFEYHHWHPFMRHWFEDSGRGTTLQDVTRLFVTARSTRKFLWHPWP